MPQTLLDQLAGTKLTELMKSDAVKRGVKNTLPPKLFVPSPTKPRSDKVEWLEYKGTRTGARVVARSSPSRARALPGVTRREATALNFKETMTLDAEMREALVSDNPIVNRNAQLKFVEDVANFRQFFDTSRVNAVASVFAQGCIYVDADGNILPNSTGAVQTIGPGITGTNKMTYDGASGSYALGDFSVAGTDIGLALRNFRDAQIKKNNFVADTIIYGTNMPTYLAKNTVHKDYFARNPEQRAAIVSNGVIPNGTLGFNWLPVHSMYMALAGATADDETTSTWYGGDFIGIMPEIESSWYELFEGGNEVPKTMVQPGASLPEMLAALTIENGLYSYAEMTVNPVTLSVHMGDSFLPVIKTVDVYAAGKCTP